MKDVPIRINNPLFGDEDDSGEGGGGLRVDFYLDDPRIERPLTSKEIALLKEQAERQQKHVKEAKVKKQALQNARENKGLFQQNKSGMKSKNTFRNHPILSTAAQFSGMDKQETVLPNETEVDVNQEQQAELQERLVHQARPNPQPRATPRPSPL